MRLNAFCVGAAVFVLLGTTTADARPAKRQRVVVDSDSTSWIDATWGRPKTWDRPSYVGRMAHARRRASDDESDGDSRSNRGRRGTLASLSGGGNYSVGPRPGAWCGWWMRTQLGGGPEYNLAWNWRNYGSPTSAQVGAVVVWRHHVGIITGQTSDGRWIVKSGNDGGRVRERPRSVAGAIFRI